MYIKLSDAKLKTGENMEIGVVLTPDKEYADRITGLLHHKGEPWLTHVNKALIGEIKELETRFYIGHIGGQVVSNIMTVEYNRAGILGHVFTLPEHRRKHACSLIMREQMEDFKRRGGGLLLLGTGYNSPPYWIYYSFGFRSLSEGSGFMRFSTEDDFEIRYLSPGKAKAVDVEWKHWPVMNILMSVHGIEVLRSLVLSLFGIANFEGGFLSFIKRLEEGHLKAKLLESEWGAVVGFIVLERDRRWTSKTYMLDVFVHPNFVSDYETLLNALELPEGKIQCYVDAKSPDEKIKALQSAGFKREAVFERQFVWNNEWLSVYVYSKFTG